MSEEAIEVWKTEEQIEEIEVLKANQYLRDNLRLMLIKELSVTIVHIANDEFWDANLRLHTSSAWLGKLTVSSPDQTPEPAPDRKSP